MTQKASINGKAVTFDWFERMEAAKVRLEREILLYRDMN
jgi:hypothetical protein